MSYLALARKWRPGKFSDVIGQDHVVSALTNALNTQRVHHAFLFTGTRGVGKTTLARIFAKALNCEKGISSDPCGECMACRTIDQGNFVDLIEVDAASRTKVDDTRELLDNVQYTPTQGRFKIYLIDEVHMLSTHSFNALLKTLEEPPEHVKFLLATTDPQKLPTTILSRCIQFNLRSVDLQQLDMQLEKILQSEKIGYDAQALSIISRSAKGSVRDALSLLDQAIGYTDSDISAEKVRQMLGMIDDQLVIDVLEQIIAGDCHRCLDTINEMASRSADYISALDDLLTLIHNVALFQAHPGALDWKGIDIAPIEALSAGVDAQSLQLYYQIALMGKKDIDYAPDPRSGFEMIVIRMISFNPNSTQISSPQTSASGNVSSVREGGESRIVRPGEVSQASHPGSESKVLEPPPLQSVDSVMESATESVALSRSASARVKLEDLDSVAGWQDFAQNSGINGILGQLLMNMVPKSVEGNQISVSLAESSRHLFNEQRLRKIEQYCLENLSLDFKIQVEIEDLSNSSPDMETPFQKIDREQREQLSEAERAFQEDPNVRRIVDAFDAEIVADSIKPNQLQ
jgi:DNA polymerase-3 subunit gamma/tau